MVQAFLDSKLNKFISRKFLVWLSSSGLLLANKIDGEQWVYISMIYIGTQAVIDSFLQWKGKAR
jgi:hypothetical protein|tara:strand:+ start:455 stop:646 length:192 start_codon:yes stop_codon:yes gene_type:complete